MKKILIFITFVAIMAGTAYADSFQFIERARNSYIANGAIYISNQLQGYTDGYGRIRINLPRGTYEARLRIRNRPDIVIRLTLDGSSTMKIVYVP